jgi:alpha-L-rhamnosidase
MEWLDFRALPQDWGVLNFTDTTWAKATQTSLFTQAIQNPTTATRGCVFRPLPPSFTPAYQPRSIPLLVNVPSLPALIEVGALSPGRLTFQAPFSEEASSYSFQVANPIVFTVEVLSLSATANLIDTVHLNGLPLTWLPAGGNRPGVWVGLLPVEPGIHTLTNQNLNAFPIFNVFTDGLQVAPPMIQPGHPGHRMLLADPVPDHTLVTVLPGPALNLRVEQTPAYLILDVGRVMYGRLSAEVLGPPGTLIDIGWDEKLYQPSNSSGPGRPLPFPGHLHSNWSQVDSWIMDGNSHPLSTLDARVGRYIVINVWGNSPVEIRNLQVIEERYPTTPRGEFVSPDPLLNQIWHVGAVTAQLNMLDAYSDPWRERGQWWGDAYVVDRTNRVAFGDLALLRRGLLYMADGFEEGNPAAFAPSGREVHILDYGMLWVQSLEAYITLTHDEAFLMETYPVLKAFLNHLQAKTNAAGLLNITSAHWSQSTYLDSRATFNRHGQSAAVNAIYYGTLNSAANLADWMGDTPFAQTWRTQAEAVKEQVNAQLYLPEEGRFAATYLYGEFFAPSAYSQAWPLAYGLVPETEIPRVVAALREYVSSEPQKPTVDIYGMNWVLEALARNGYMNEALDLIRLYYGYMLEAGATTWWESFTAPERHETAQSHGWGSSPTWLLTTYLLGGRWTGPDTWEVRPALQGVTNLSGSLPIGEHDLLISWQVTSCSHAEIEIRAPSHTTGELVLPFTDVETLTLNGSDILEDNSPFLSEITVQADGLHIPLAGRPEYRFTVEHPCL